MEALKEIGFIIFCLIFVFAITNIIVNLYWRWRLRQYDKASADYFKEVEEHQAKMRKEYELPMRDAAPNNDSTEYRIKTDKFKKTYIPSGKDAERSEAFSTGSQLAGSFGVNRDDLVKGMGVPASLLDEDTKLFIQHSQEKVSGESFGHGGDFGGGGASGSWDSGSDSSSSDSGSSYSD